jgi:hypothetical protein
MPRLDFRTTLDVTLPPHHALVVRLLIHYVNDLRSELDLDPITEAQLVQTIRALQPPPAEQGA